MIRKLFQWLTRQPPTLNPEPPVEVYQGHLEKAIGANFSVRIRRNGTWTCTCGLNGGGGATNLYRHRQHDHR